MKSFASTRKVIVFDLDGTLIDSLALTFDGFNHALLAMGSKAVLPEEIMRLFGKGEGAMLASLLGPEKADEAYVVFRRYIDDNVGRIPLHAGVADLLGKLSSAGVPISIFTGRSWTTTEIILRHHGLLERFVTIVADDHVSQSKPSPEGLLLALDRMGAKPRDALFVGDSPLDILAARSGGAQGVAATWDLLAKREALEASKPEYWATSPAEVWEVWRKFATRETTESAAR